MSLRLLFLFALPFILSSCARAEPILPDLHKLTDRKGQPTEYYFQVAHSEEESALLMLISGPMRPEKIDVFLDVSADIVLDRPVQYIYGLTLKW